jgi:hypothetical protein
MPIKFGGKLKSLSIISAFFILLAAGNPITEASFQQKKELGSPAKDIVLIEKEIFELLNKERQKHGLAILMLSQPLTLVARKHSRDMAAHENLGHLSSSGENYTDRSSASLENVYPVYKEKAMDEIYETAGLGVCFLRNEKNRGGSYFITLLLFPENKYKKWSKKCPE